MGTKTLSRKICPVTEALSANLPSIVGVETPFESLSTIKPLKIPCSSFAQMTNTSAIGEFVIQFLEPFKTYPPSFSVALVFIDPGSEPASASVNPKHPSLSPLAISGR